MAQKDAKVNIALAESSAAIAKASKEDSAVMRTIAIESKKDSSAMKTIAVLGMFFLPGTFVAALFAMPVFDWDNNTPAVKTGFKYYWAVTIPLTLFVILSWGLAMLLPLKSWLSMVKGGRKYPDRDVGLIT
jgi:Mg2+ and Co2+ transporter CorA